MGGLLYWDAGAFLYWWALLYKGPPSMGAVLSLWEASLYGEPPSMGASSTGVGVPSFMGGLPLWGWPFSSGTFLHKDDS